jgi:hypothetical protein
VLVVKEGEWVVVTVVVVEESWELVEGSWEPAEGSWELTKSPWFPGPRGK